MFLQTLETLGTFFGGLGTLLGGTVQLLQFLKKKNDEEAGADGSDIGGGREVPPWMTAHLCLAA